MRQLNESGAGGAVPQAGPSASQPLGASEASPGVAQMDHGPRAFPGPSSLSSSCVPAEETELEGRPSCQLSVTSCFITQKTTFSKINSLFPTLLNPPIDFTFKTIFYSSFKFTVKLRGDTKISRITPPPVINVPHQNGTPVTADTDYPRPIVYITGHSRCRTFYVVHSNV